MVGCAASPAAAGRRSDADDALDRATDAALPGGASGPERHPTEVQRGADLSRVPRRESGVL
jgi:hypothetical protein